MGDEVCIRDDVSRLGLRRVHVLRVGKPVDVDGLMGRLGVGEGELLGRLVYEDEDSHVWHARLYWRESGQLAVVSDQ